MKIKYFTPTKTVKRALFTAIALVGSSAVLADEFSDVFTKGTVSADFRLRNEQVDQTGKSDAFATTLRSRVTVRSGLFYDFQIGGQYDYVTSVDDENRYNAFPDLCPGHPYCNNARVIDPDGGYLNESFLKYTGISKTALIYGRQHIDLDNERFVGSVAWRQHDQTFDGFKAESELIPHAKFTAAYIYNVNRVFGDDVGNGEHPEDTYLYNMAFPINDAFKPVLYHYDIEDNDHNVTNGVPNVDLSNKNTGVRVTGSYPKKEGDRLIYAAEFASQHEGNDSTVNYSANYRLLEVGGEYKTVQLTVGHEVLGGDADGTTATEFQTPLATLHKFNGWADEFLTTPDGGLVDQYVAVTIPAFDFKTIVAYHDFKRDDTNHALGITQALGDEWDISVGRKFMKNYNVAVKYADYESDNEAFSNNKSTRKWWIEATAHFE